MKCIQDIQADDYAKAKETYLTKIRFLVEEDITDMRILCKVMDLTHDFLVEYSKDGEDH